MASMSQVYIVWLVPRYCLLLERLPCGCVYHGVGPAGNMWGAIPPPPATLMSLLALHYFHATHAMPHTSLPSPCLCAWHFLCICAWTYTFPEPLDFEDNPCVEDTIYGSPLD